MVSKFWSDNNLCLDTQYNCKCSDPWRTADGSCNNLNNPTWGKANRAHKRLLPPHYGDSK